MKKVIRFSLFIAAIAVLFASCKAHEKCPAYGQQAKPKVSNEVRS